MNHDDETHPERGREATVTSAEPGGGGSTVPDAEALARRAVLTHDLEERLRHLTGLLYDTAVAPERLLEEVLPVLSETVTFKDPWQSASGRASYALGMRGFHDMLAFRFEFHQVSVQLDPPGTGGRALVDGVMHLGPAGGPIGYRLRTILRYDFTLAPGLAGAGLRIEAHEEMWSLGDMIEALPLAGRLYVRGFRPAFARGFLAASRLAARWKDRAGRR